MRIAFSGAQGVGKSTICEQLKNKLISIKPNKNIAVIGNISRYLIKQYKINTDVKSNNEDYYLYIAEYIKRLLNTEADIIINDRTLLDSMAHQLYNNNASSNYYAMLREIVRWYLRDIDYYFYIPIQFEMDDDGVRYVDNHHQKEIDKMIMKLLKEFNVEYVVLHGNIENRINIILETIESNNLNE